MKATYKDVKSDILSKITTGEWAPGNLVPNEVDLAATYGCARATVNRAMRELADDGLIERRRKAGTRVRMTPIRQARFDIPIVRVEIEEKGAEYRYSLVSSSVEPAPDWLRARLKLSNKSKVLRLVCMHYADGDPYQHEDRWINLEAVDHRRRNRRFCMRLGRTNGLVSTIPFSDVEISFFGRIGRSAADGLSGLRHRAIRFLPSNVLLGGRGRPSPMSGLPISLATV